MELPFFTSGSSSSATTRAEALRWLAISEKLLAGRDLVGSKSFAGRAREFDPSLLYADQIIAVADTLLAGDKRINNQHDWYSILQLAGHQTHDSELIASQYRKLALLLNPQKNKLPYADHAFNLVVNAWSILSNPSRKSLYDNELMSHLGVNSVSSGFNPITTGVTREHVNFQPFEINFQVMPQHQQQQGMVREQVSQPIPQHAMSREHVHLSQQLPQQNVNREPVGQPLSQLNLSREQVRQPPPQPQPQAHPHPHPQMPPQVQQQVQTQSQPQPQPQQKKDYWMGSNVTHNFTGTFENSTANANANANNDDDVSGNTNNATENVENSEDRVDERRLDDASDDGELSFWTACPYCYYMYEYPSVYAECALKCQTCKKAFQAVPLPSPPPIVEGQEAYFCCWGLMPLGVSMEILERNKKGGNWTPFSPMFTCPRGFGRSGDTRNANNFRGWNGNNVNNSAPRSTGSNVGGRMHSAPKVFVDEDEVFVEISGSSEESDDDWQNQKNSQKRKKTTKGVKKTASVTPSKISKKFQVDKGKNVNGREGDHVEVLQEGVDVPAVSVAESSKKGAALNTRRQSARVANFSKLDLNVEFSNDAEEPVRRGNQGNGAARGEEDIIEGSGFFEGLDEFLSSLPILNVVGDDKVKAA